jgi:hypothetical protein
MLAQNLVPPRQTWCLWLARLKLSLTGLTPPLRRAQPERTSATNLRLRSPTSLKNLTRLRSLIRRLRSLIRLMLSPAPSQALILARPKRALSPPSPRRAWTHRTADETR